MKRWGLLAMLLLIAAATYPAAYSCKHYKKVCIEGPATKTIQGRRVYRSCWKYRSQKLCTDNRYTLTCGPLTRAGCRATGSRCTESDVDGRCKRYTLSYECDQRLPPTRGVTFVRSHYEVTSDRWDERQCNRLEDGPHCAVVSHECLEPNETRNINGLAVRRDCWRYRKTVECLGAQRSDCDSLETATDCEHQSEHCKLTGTQATASGLCTLKERRYQCQRPSGVESPTLLNCQNQVYCLDGSCYTASEPPNRNFAQVASYLAMIDKMAKDFDQDELVLFKGEPLKCSKRLLGYSNCCRGEGWGQDLGLDQCSEKEQRLAEGIAAKSTHYMGSYCSKKTFLGVCVRKTKSYCHFNSKLGRIIQQQARIQLGKRWGSKKRPDCSGITPQQLQSLDFSEVEFREFFEDVYRDTTLPDPAATTEAMSDRIQNYYDQNQ